MNSTPTKSPVSKECLDLIRRWESFRAEPYLCPAGYPTIGYGSRFYLTGIGVSMKDPPISLEKAEELLAMSAQVFWDLANGLIKPKLNPNQMAAVTSFVWNIGPGAFRTSSLLKLINKFPESPKIRDEFLRWKHINGNPSKGLLNRRKAEADLYFTPVK